MLLRPIPPIKLGLSRYEISALYRTCEQFHAQALGKLPGVMELVIAEYAIKLNDRLDKLEFQKPNKKKEYGIAIPLSAAQQLHEYFKYFSDAIPASLFMKLHEALLNRNVL